MFSNQSFKTQFVFLSLVLNLGLVACVKKRPDMIPDGTNLQQLSDFAAEDWKSLAGKENVIVKTTPYKITVTKSVEKVENSKAQKVEVGKNSYHIKFLDIVSFTTDDPLLSGRSEVAEMLGEPGKVYGVVHEISPNFLTISKVVSDEEISHYEIPYSKKVGSKWYVPIGGYSIIGFYNKGYQKNSDDRNTNVLGKFEVPREEFKRAQTYLIDKENFEPFERELKTDVLPKEIFHGEWYFSEAVSDARYDSGDQNGVINAQDALFNPVSRIFFRVQDDYLWGYNSNLDETLKSNNLNYNVVIKVPLKMEDFRRKRYGSSSLGLAEEENVQKELSDNKYVKLNLAGVETPGGTIADLARSAIMRFLNQFNSLKEIKEFYVSDDYISFSMEDGESGSIRRYSLLKVPNSKQIPAAKKYTTKRHDRKDFLHFGFFDMMKAQKMDYRTARREDIDSRLYLARFNPKEDIVYHFSKVTPKDKWVRDIGREAINLWQQAFAMAGVDITVKLDESFDVDVGDIRYNILNITSNDGGNKGGFGPSLIDTQNGEIVSAVSNVYQSSFINGAYARLRSYISRKAGIIYDMKDNGQSPSDLTPFQNLARMSHILATRDENNQIAPYNLLEDKADKVQFTDVEKVVLKTLNINPEDSYHNVFNNYVKAESFYDGGFFKFSDQTTNYGDTQFVEPFIEKLCPEVQSVVSMAKKGNLTTAQEVEILQPCAHYMAQAFLLRALTHEMGHNFGLRHNFIASTDKKNFIPKEAYQFKYVGPLTEALQSETASLMDYDPYETFTVHPSGYDIAAIRWAYSNTIELDSAGAPGTGTMVKIDPTKTIDQNPALAGKKIRPYAFCTDEHAYYGLDAFCRQSDWGTDSYTIVAHAIDNAYAILPYIYRYNRLGSYNGAGIINNTLSVLKAHYDKWRTDLLNITGLKKSYLEGFSAKEYQELIQQHPQLKQGLKTRNLIVFFLLDIAFMNDRYCVTTNSAGMTEAVELERIRRELYSLGELSVVSSCQSPAAKKYLAQQDLTFVKEVGHFLNAAQYDLNPYDLETSDVSGTEQMRLMAFSGLTGRFTTSLTNLKESYLPTLMDEPDIRQAVTDILMNRVVNGVKIREERFDVEKASVDHLLTKADLGSFLTDPKKKEEYLVNFSAEKDLITSMMQRFATSLQVPGSPKATENRFGGFYIGSTNNPKLVEGQHPPGGIVGLGNKYYYVPSDQGGAAEFIQVYKQLESMISSTEIKVQDLEKAFNAIFPGVKKALLASHQAIHPEDVLKIGMSVEASLKNPQVQSNKALSQVLNVLFGPEISLTQQIMNFLNQIQVTPDQFLAVIDEANNSPSASPAEGDTPSDQGSSDTASSLTEQQKTQILKFAQQDLTPIYEKMGQSSVLASDLPTVKGMQNRATAFFQQYEKEKTYVDFNGDELTAQANLLQTLIMMFGN